MPFHPQTLVWSLGLKNSQCSELGGKYWLPSTTMQSSLAASTGVDTADECLLLIKSSREQFDALREAIEKLHPYEIPEILALPVLDGSPNYLHWLASSLRPESAK